MARRKRDTKAILRIIERSEERSPLFYWMVEHHDEILQAAGGKRIRWAPFCAKAVALGLVDTRGQAPTERNARETWAQARRAMQEARAELEARPEKPIYPSRMPKWTPPAILEAIAAGNPAVDGAAARGATVPVVPPPSTGTALALAARPPPPKPPSPPPEAPAGGKLLSQYAKPGDSIEMQQKLRAAEDRLKKFDRWMIKE
jgi:hypothetical protein